VLALEVADQGFDIVILEGRAMLMNDPQVTAMMASCLTKYAEIPRRRPPEERARKFCRAIRVTPTKQMAWITNRSAGRSTSRSPDRSDAPIAILSDWRPE
jgi:hypothetical protein